MPRFFVTADAITGGLVSITGDDARHISHSLRMRPGEEITVCDMRRREYRCRLSTFTGERVEAEILAEKESENEPPYFATLYMALPKGDKMEWIIQKSVELGVSRILPFSSSRCIAKLDEAGGQKKRARWQKIASAAAGQCGRGILPEIGLPRPFHKALAEAAEGNAAGGLSFFCYEGETERSLPALLAAAKKRLFPPAPSSPPPEISFFVGAEGGFSIDEAEAAREAGLPAVGLGRRILRCETAPLFVLSCLACLFELPPGRTD